MAGKRTSKLVCEVVLLAVANKCEKELTLWYTARRIGILWRIKSRTNMRRLQKSYNEAVSNPLHILPKNSLLGTVAAKAASPKAGPERLFFSPLSSLFFLLFLFGFTCSSRSSFCSSCAYSCCLCCCCCSSSSSSSSFVASLTTTACDG